MGNKTLRINLPPHVHKVLKERARECGLNMRQFARVKLMGFDIVKESNNEQA